MSYDDEFGYSYYDEKQLAYTLTPGDADFKIINVENKVSRKTSNNMLHIVMDVRDASGKTGKIDEYLVHTPGDDAGLKRLATKIAAIAKAINKPELYGPGVKLTPNALIGCRGKCIVKTQSGGDFPDKSVIAKYISALEERVPQRMEEDEEIPF